MFADNKRFAVRGGTQSLHMPLSGRSLSSNRSILPPPSAFLTIGGTPRDIGVLRGHLLSNATDINNSGQVVGHSQDLTGDARAFLFSEGELYDLNDLVMRASGWRFRAANAINNNGQIVGEALVQGISRAYLLTPIRRGKD